MLNDGRTYEDISVVLQRRGVSRGSSVANVRKYCTDLGINRRAGVVTDDALQSAVESAITQVCFRCLWLKVQSPMCFLRNYGHT